MFRYNRICIMNTLMTSDVLKALADETRLNLVRKMIDAKEPISSCDLVNSCASFLNLSQPAISHHFSKLVAAGVISEQKHGTQKSYSLNRQLLQSIGINVNKL